MQVRPPSFTPRRYSVSTGEHTKADANMQYGQGYALESEGKAEEAIYWYRLAAEQGHPGAQHKQGHFLALQGNTEEAIYWCRLAADGGHSGAQFQLGRLYEIYKGDTLTATSWYKKALDGGYIPAIQALRRQARRRNPAIDAEIILRQLGETDEEQRESLAEIQLRAQHGAAVAQYRIGVFWQYGVLVGPRNLQIAIYWYNLAAAQGHGPAGQALERIARNKRDGGGRSLYFE
jgi:TPR repeat protein